MCPTNYCKSFTKNTKTLLEEYFCQIKNDAELEVTFLMNCLLGLIVNVSEKKKNQKKVKISDFAQFLPETFLLWSDTTNKLETVMISDSSKYSFKKYFLKHLRNGISHSHIIAEPDSNDNWHKVIISDFYTIGKKKGLKNFEISLTIEQLYKLALKTAELFNN